MRLNFFSIALVLFLVVDLAVAQKKQYIFFLTDSGKRVSNRDSCDYIRVVTEPDSGSTLYGVDEYYKNNKLKLSGKAVLAGGPQLDGECVRYYLSGKKQSISHYDKGILTGHLYTFFPNGRLYDDKIIDPKKEKDNRHDFGFSVVASNDSTGKEMVVDGTGYYVDYNGDYKWVKEEGELKNGLKEGEWKGKFYLTTKIGNKIDSIFYSYVENYEADKLKSGKSIDASSIEYQYSQRQAEPRFNGGPDAFNRYLSNNIKFPVVDWENNVTGKVYVSYIVEKDGSLSDVKAVRGPSETEKAEAVRAIKLSPKWMPGKLYGVPVRISYTVPVNFTKATN